MKKPSPPCTPDFAKVRAAVERMQSPGQTPKALELIASAPVHIRPAPIRMKLPPEDAARRKPTKAINYSASRSGFHNRQFFH